MHMATLSDIMSPSDIQAENILMDASLMFPNEPKYELRR